MRRRRLSSTLSLLALTGILLVPVPGPLAATPSMDLKDLGIDMGLPSPPTGPFETLSLSLAVDPSEVETLKMAGFDLVTLSGSKLRGSPGEPLLPVRVTELELPPGARVLGLRVVGGEYVELEGDLVIAPMPKPQTWLPPRGGGPPGEVGREGGDVLSPDPEVYSSEAYLPGVVARVRYGSDGRRVLAFVEFFPVQYSPARRRAVLITSARVELYYVAGEEGPAEALSPILTGAEGVIITTEGLRDAAEELAELHADWGVPTAVVTVEEIARYYPPAGDPPLPGYWNETLPDRDRIVGYDYDLAKRIISYLRDRVAHPNLRYVTILGDSDLVPPSFYYYDEGWWGGGYEAWIPTDYLYASPDYDLVPDYAVGRLPVNSSAAGEVVDKLASWSPGDWFWSAALIAGPAFPFKEFHGELLSVDTVNEGYLSDFRVRKLYYSTGDLTPDSALEAYGGGYGLIYEVNHGSGDGMWLYNFEGFVELVDVGDLLSMPESTELPVVVSVACDNAAFDEELWSVGFPISFGEGLLLSPAGGVAYFGATRVAYAGLDWGESEGYVVDAYPFYMDQMTQNFFLSYSEGVRALGDAALGAWRLYAMWNDVSGSDWSALIDRRTLLETALLGDPALTLPRRGGSQPGQRPLIEAVDPDGHSPFSGEPYYWTDGPAAVRVSSPGDEVTVYRVNWTVHRVDDLAQGRGEFDYSFSAGWRGEYLVRAESPDGMEGWLFLHTVPPQTGARVLLVEDVWDYAHYEFTWPHYYEDALSGLGEDFDVWPAYALGYPDAGDLRGHGVAIWYTPSDPPGWLWGNLFSAAGALEEYLDSGGRLFLSGQDIGDDYNSWAYDPYLLDFYRYYLHAEYVGHSNIFQLEGVPGDPISDGLTIGIEGGDGAWNQWLQEEVNPAEGGVCVFTYTGDGCGAVRADTGVYRVVYFAFGFEAINSSADRAEVMSRVLDWLSEGAGTTRTGLDWVKRVTSDANPDHAPSVATSPAGHAYVAYQSFVGGDYEIYLAKYSPAGGRLWAKRLTYSSGDSEMPSVAVAPNGYVYVAYSDDSYGQYEVVLKKVKWDGTVVWTKRLTMARWSPGDSIYPSVAVAPNGYVYVAYSDDSPGNFEIYLKKVSAQGKVLWTKRLTMARWSPGDSLWPSVAVGPDGHIYVAYSDDSYGQYEVVLKELTSGGKVLWTRRLTRDDDLSIYPRLTASPTGDLYVAFLGLFEGMGDAWTWTLHLDASGNLLHGVGYYAVEPRGPPGLAVEPGTGTVAVTLVSGGSLDVVAFNPALSPINRIHVDLGDWTVSACAGASADGSAYFSLEGESSGFSDIYLIRIFAASG